LKELERYNYPQLRFRAALTEKRERSPQRNTVESTRREASAAAPSRVAARS
jgi:hypothetical protein